MKKYVAHGHYSVYDHCFRVALFAYSYAKCKGIKVDYWSLIRGSMLHDYYLYDWHHTHEGHRLHGFRHPYFALHNAKKRFTLNMFESFVYCFSVKKENPKYNAYYGGRVLITERSDIIYLLKKNLELERFKNLILRDNQLLLLNSLTKFLLDPERVNLLDFEKCSYDKFIDFYDNIATNASMIDIKLSKWVETKYKIEHINTYNNNNNN